jgi:hypothetical protein
MQVASYWKARPAEVFTWSESEIALCIAQIKREHNRGP